jgi:outer membrane protein OmpA-like peptidoglycan-associated protein
VNFYLAKDVDANPSPFDPTSNNVGLAGLQLFHETESGSYRYRFGARYLTDLNVDQRSYHVFQISFQIGLPVGRSTNSQVTPSRTTYNPPPTANTVLQTDYVDPGYGRGTQESEAPKKKVRPHIEVISSGNRNLKLRLDTQAVRFATDSAAVSRDTQARLTRMGIFLRENNSKWERLIVSGHTDERGSDKYNYHLSMARARTVRQILIDAGVFADKIRVQGFGENVPLDRRSNEEAWSKNRRVEFEFLGVSDLNVITDGIQREDDVE